jgi:gluconate 2-dehydrogenase gamma chain
MNRRDTLKLIALYTGGTVSLSTFAGLLNGCNSPKDTGAPYVPEILTRDQDELFARIAELIIPATDTPGAAEAGVNRFADYMLAHWCTPGELQVFLDGLVDLDNRAREEFGASFIGMGEDRQIAMLSNLEEKSNGVWMPRNADETSSFIAMAKFLTIVGYYTSEIGATQELRTNIAPGTFKSCIPYEKAERAWSGA